MSLVKPSVRSKLNALVPLLDDALLSLREKDRTALLLRFYESQSLRNVGATIGASEDTAQERVQSALEKVAEFFKRRGFKTASVAVATAALEHTAVTASASLVNTIVGTALPAAPAPAGFGLLLARLAGLTKVQTAALCVALAAGPVGWQVKERHTAGEKAKWMREQLLRARSDSSAAQAETERLRVDSSNLEQSLAQVNEAAQAYEAWKKDALAQLTAADYRWSDDLPFVRIPKEILPELSELIRIPTVSPPGVVNEYVIDLLCLTPAERQAMEEIFQRVAELQSGEKADVYETELSAKGRVVASRLFTTEPAGKSGPEAEQRFAQMLDDIRGILGEERWPLLPSRLRSVNCEVLNHMLIPEPGTKVSASVENDENGIPQAKWVYSGEMSKVANPGPRSEKAPAGNVYSLNVVGYMNSSAALSAFLPDSNPDQRKRATSLGGVPAPEVLRQRAAAWFQEQAVARQAGRENP